MLRKLALVVSFACLVFVAAMIVSCGSSSNNHLTTTCTGGPFNVVGDWDGTLSLNGSTFNVAGVINTQGEALFFDADSESSEDPNFGSVAALPTITGACSFSGTVTLFQAPSSTDASSTLSVTGSVSSATAITLSGSSQGTTDTFTLNSFNPLTGSLGPVTGSQDAEIAQGAILPTLTFTNPTGNNMMFNSGDASCGVNGSFTQEGTNNVFDVSITFSGTAGCVTGTLTGLGFESNTDIFGFNGGVAGTYLYAIDSGTATVVEIFTLTAGRDLHERPAHSFAAKPRAFIFR